VEIILSSVGGAVMVSWSVVGVILTFLRAICADVGLSYGLRGEVLALEALTMGNVSSMALAMPLERLWRIRPATTRGP
jgi:hypothetical protein